MQAEFRLKIAPLRGAVSVPLEETKPEKPPRLQPNDVNVCYQKEHLVTTHERRENIMSIETAMATDLDTLRELNEQYIRSVQESDVQWFDANLSDDFMCTFSDGTFLDRSAFLEHTEHPATLSNLRAHDVIVRQLGDFAIIHARTTFTGPDGSPGASRYTDVWQRRNGKWLAISAHITRY
jgi:ketosteroid isomerase-like protein